jgi:hypothetical protein
MPFVWRLRLISAKLRAFAYRIRVRRIIADLETSHEFASVAEREFAAGHQDTALEACRAAHGGYADILQRLATVRMTRSDSERVLQLLSNLESILQRLDQEQAA